MSVFDLRGRLVRQLADARGGPGGHSITWDGRGSHGAPVPTGVYVARLTARDGAVTSAVQRKLVILR